LFFSFFHAIAHRKFRIVFPRMDKAEKLSEPGVVEIAEIAKRVYPLARDQDDSALRIGAYRALAVTFNYLGDLESARRYAMRGVQMWRCGGVESPIEEFTAPAVSCLSFEALSQ
jgi:hypothetical protein